jgi:hypothetical protein
MGALPYVLAEAPPGWRAAEVARPKIAESAGATLTQWEGAESPSADAVLVRGCVGTPIPGWVDDMRPAIEARTTALTGAAAEKATGFPVDARWTDAGAFVLRPSSRLEGTPIGLSRTFLGWSEGRVFTCFAVCARRRDEGLAGCESSVSTAVLEGGGQPPEPGLALRSATWAIHHPDTAATLAFAVLVAAGVIAVATRRRPRSSLGRASRLPRPIE